MVDQVAQAEIRARYLGYIDETSLVNGFAELNLDTGEVVRAGSSGPEASHLPDIATDAPDDGDILIWSASNSQWEPGAPPASGYTFPYHSDGSDSTAINNTTTETEYDTSGFTLPADAFSTAGDFIRFEFSGLLVGVGISGTLTIRLKSDSTTLATGFTISAPGGGSAYFSAHGTITATAIGASGQVTTDFTGRLYNNALVNSSNRSAVTVDTTASMDIGITAQWSSAVPSNQTRLHKCTFVLNKVVT